MQEAHTELIRIDRLEQRFNADRRRRLGPDARRPE